MPPIPVPIEVSRGWHTASTPQQQPPGTSRSLLNVVPRDWGDGGTSRLTQRPSTYRVRQNAVAAAPVDAMAVFRATDGLGPAKIGSLLTIDPFTRTTSAGDMGDYDGDASADWAVRHGTFDMANAGTGGTFAFFDNPYATSTPAYAAQCGGTAAIDGNTANTKTSTGAVLSACAFSPTNTTVNVNQDSMGIQITFTINGSVGANGGSFVGAFFHANSTPARDGAFWCGLCLRNNTSNRVVFSAQYNTSSLSANNAPNTLAARSLPTAIASGSHTLDIRKIDDRVEVRLDNALYRVYYFKVAIGTGVPVVAPVNTSLTAYGLLLSDIGSNANNYIASIDDFSVYDVDAFLGASDHAIIAACNDDIYVGAEDADFAVVENGTGAIDSPRDCMMIPSYSLGTAGVTGQFPLVYILDGVTYQVLNLASMNVTPWLVTAGALPVRASDAAVKASIGCEWDARFVVAIDNAIHMSRRYNWGNWDIAPSQLDGDEAYAFNAPFEIAALMPMDPSVLAIGGREQIDLLVGNPAINGRVERLDGVSGVCGKFAWAVDDRGNLYYVGLPGLYRLDKGSLTPILLSEGRIDKFFKDIDHSAYHVRLSWHRHYRALLIMVTPRTGYAQPTHVWWDRQSDQFGDFWPLQFPEYHSPISTAILHSRRSPDRDRILLGGYDGVVRSLSSDIAHDDDNNAVNAYADVIMATGADDDLILEQMELSLPELSGAVGFEIRRGVTADKAILSDPVSVGTVPGGSFRRIVRNVRGNAVAVRVKNDAMNERLAVSEWRVKVDRGAATEDRR